MNDSLIRIKERERSDWSNSFVERIFTPSCLSAANRNNCFVLSVITSAINPESRRSWRTLSPKDSTKPRRTRCGSVDSFGVNAVRGSLQKGHLLSEIPVGGVHSPLHLLHFILTVNLLIKISSYQCRQVSEEDL